MAEMEVRRSTLNSDLNATPLYMYTNRSDALPYILHACVHVNSIQFINHQALRYGPGSLLHRAIEAAVRCVHPLRHTCIPLLDAGLTQIFNILYACTGRTPRPSP